MSSYAPEVSDGTTGGNLAAYFSTIFTGLLGLCCYIVWRYAEPGFPKLTFISNIIGYYVGFGIILVVPIDIASAIIDRRGVETGTSVEYEDNIQSLSEAYGFFFGMIVVFCGFYLVFEEYYNTDGYFTIKSRIWSSFKLFLRDTIAMIVIGGIVLYLLIEYKVVPQDQAALTLTAVILTNTVYETFLMFLLGYGLVEFPRMIWKNSSIEDRQKLVQTKAASDFKDITDAHFAISIEVANALKTSQTMGSTSDVNVRSAMETILSECPPEFRSSRAGQAAVDKNDEITIDTLASLRTKLKFYKSSYRMACSKVESTKLEAYQLEDIIDARDRNTEGHSSYDGKMCINWSLSGKPSTEWDYKW